MFMIRKMTVASLALATGVLAGGVLAGAALADDTVTTTTKTTTYAGTVSEIRPSDSTIILRSDASPSPVTYTYTKETSFVDQDGRTVSYETIRNAPVRVEYSTDGGRTIVRRVVQTGPAVIVPGPAGGAMAVPAPVPSAGSVIREESTRTKTTD